MRKVAVFDIDGVLANVAHRLHHLRGKKNWKMFFAEARNDARHSEGFALMKELAEEGHDIVFLTGRPEHCRRDTITWLQAALAEELADAGIEVTELRMRPKGNFGKSADTKAYMLKRLAEELAEEGREIAVVIDDDPTVVAAHRANGFNVVHATWAVEDENFAHAQQQEGRV